MADWFGGSGSVGSFTKGHFVADVEQFWLSVPDKGDGTGFAFTRQTENPSDSRTWKRGIQ